MRKRIPLVSLFLWFLLLVVVALVVQPVVRIVATFLTAARPAVRILTMPLRVLKHPGFLSPVVTFLMARATPVLVDVAKTAFGACKRLANILAGRPAASANYVIMKSSIFQALRETGLRVRQLSVRLTRLWDLPSVGETAAGSSAVT